MHFGWIPDSSRSGAGTDLLFNHLRHDLLKFVLKMIQNHASNWGNDILF